MSQQEHLTNIALRPVRVTAGPTIGNPGATVRFDVFIDTNGVIVGKQPMFGMQGRFALHGAAESYPFVLYADGTVDFGTNTDHDRLGRLTVFDAPVEVDRLLTLRSVHGINGYRISEVRDLPVR